MTPRVHAEVTDSAPSLDAVASLVADPRAGAVVTFTGATRDVERLQYEGYAEMAQEVLEAIVGEVARAHGAIAVAAVHRLGDVPLGEASVVVAASAAHRPQAFSAAREAIDRIKAEVPIWKKEVDGDHAEWVEGTPVREPR